MTRSPWWHGTRGEWYVVVQAGLFALVALGPRTWTGLPTWPASAARLGTLAGTALLGIGGIMALAGMVRLGRNLTALPHPKDDADMVETGPYRLVRHPIYSGAILAALGWGLRMHGWLTIGYALLLFAFFDLKSRREERWLEHRFPGYGSYRQRVRKLIPFLY